MFVVVYCWVFLFWCIIVFLYFFFFFQAEDGIRDGRVTEFRRVLFRSRDYWGFGAYLSLNHCDSAQPCKKPRARASKRHKAELGSLYIAHWKAIYAGPTRDS